MQVPVKLPSDFLIDYRDFCRAIAKTVCPTGEEGLEGIDCIVGKLVTFYDALAEPAINGDLPPGVCLQSVLISEDGRRLEQLITEHDGDVQIKTLGLFEAGYAPDQVVERTFRFDLTDEDRSVLSLILPDLRRPLRYPISEGDAAAFMEAYCAMSDRPAWKPVLVSEATVERRKLEHAAVMRRHQNALQEELVLGRLVLVDANHVPVARLCIDSLIPRDQAIAYLERNGLAYVDTDTRCDEGDEGDVTSQERGTPALPSGGNESVIGRRKVAHPEAVYDFCLKKYNGGLKNYNMLASRHFGITGRQVRNIINQIDEQRGTPSPFPKPIKRS
ncbi:hypothetical protein AWB82_01489 [Caballeronia glebae]|uniref:Uncharacterized protein n=1 Tax=Caballeronia glebae TaxID=1777143 RepID=A0A158A024_9BURK|nr:hypothetical protein [Caballeronia glebae]SAK51093.1 hypothetical protein AWB82_01489 [Caballeronia glebae]